MTIIVTGGAGFIGSNFIFSYDGGSSGLPYRMPGLPDLMPESLSTLAPVMDKPNFRFVKESITDRDSVYKLFRRGASGHRGKLRS